jgi:hypothetical protein
MTKEQYLEMAQDQLTMACENLANQKSSETMSYKLAVEEVEACIHALKSIQSANLSEAFLNWKKNI